MRVTEANSTKLNDGMITAIQSGSAAVRLREARRFVEQFEPGEEVLLLGASRGAVDDLARAISLEKRETFGLHRLSFTQLAARLAVVELASRERTPTTALGHEAVATRAAFEARSDNALEYFSPVSQTPGFPKALARTLLDLRLAAVASADLVQLPRSGTDLAALLDRVDTLLHEAGASDRAALFETATKALGSPVTGWPPMPLLLLDVPFESEIEAQFLWALVQQSPRVMITVPAGDGSVLSQLEKRGVRFDEIAIVIRSTQQYVGLLEHALARAGVPAYFDRGTRRPDPAGRAFLAILSCATENFSAKRFAEYLSLAQVPSLDDSGRAPMTSSHSTWVASRDDVFGVLSERVPDESDDGSGDDEQTFAIHSNGDQAVVAGALRAPWKWETLLVESAVIGGSDRWARRLNGLASEYELKIRALTAKEPDSPRIRRLERERRNLVHFRGFALPLIEEMAAWLKQAAWGD